MKCDSCGADFIEFKEGCVYEIDVPTQVIRYRMCDACINYAMNNYLRFILWTAKIGRG